MPRLDPYAELQLQVTRWMLSPGNNRDALGHAGLAFRGEAVSLALPECRALAELAIAISAAPAADFPDSVVRLRDQALPARREHAAWRAEQAIDQAEAEAKRFPNLDHLEGETVGVVAPLDAYKERADL